MYLDQYFEMIRTKLNRKVNLYWGKKSLLFHSRNFYKAEIKMSQVVTVYKLEDCRD